MFCIVHDIILYRTCCIVSVCVCVSMYSDICGIHFQLDASQQADTVRITYLARFGSCVCVCNFVRINRIRRRKFHGNLDFIFKCHFAADGNITAFIFDSKALTRVSIYVARRPTNVSCQSAYFHPHLRFAYSARASAGHRHAIASVAFEVNMSTRTNVMI